MSQVAITVRDYIEQNKASLGGGAENPCSLTWVNKARYVAYGSGDWVGTLDYTGVPTQCGTFILPSIYEAIREARQCEVGDVEIQYNISRSDYSKCNGPVVMARIQGRCYCPVQLTEKSLSFTCENKNDDNTPLYVRYIDTNGSLRAERLLIPYEMAGCAELNYFPRNILKISKAITVGRIEVRAQCGQVGYLEPYETIPQYSVYASTGSHCNGPIFVKAKKRCLPYHADNLDDVLDIHPEALTSLVLACRAKEDQRVTWVQDYSALIKIATDFLKRELLNEDDTDRGMSAVHVTDEFFDSLIEDTSVVYNNG